MILVIISKYPKGANLDASAYLNESISKIWPKQAKIPIKANQDHWTNVGVIQTIGTRNDAIIAPTTPVNKSVNSGLSVEWSFLVITT